jgi:hypothetical protein
MVQSEERRKKKEGRRKKEEGRRKEEGGRRKENATGRGGPSGPPEVRLTATRILVLVHHT